MTNTVPAFGLALRLIGESPARSIVALMPGVCRDNLADAVDDLVGALQRGGIGQLHGDDQVALVLRRDEAGGHLLETEPGQADEAQIDEQHDDAAANQPLAPRAL